LPLGNGGNVGVIHVVGQQCEHVPVRQESTGR
jgi:hypothetical protein